MKWNVRFSNEKNMKDQLEKCVIYRKDHKGTYLEKNDKKQQFFMLVLFAVYIKKQMINLNRKGAVF